MLGRERIAADAAAQRIIGGLLDAESCWADACALPRHGAPPVVAGLEIAFARIGVAKHMFCRSQGAETAAALCSAADAIARAAFPDRGDEVTDAWYGAPLFVVAPQAIDRYFRAAALPRTAAGQLMQRLGSETANAWAAIPLLERSGNRVGGALRGMRIASGDNRERWTFLPKLMPQRSV